MQAVIRSCPDCQSEHLGPPCGMTFAQRLRTVQVDGRALETRTKTNYFDDASLSQQLGGMNAKDRREIHLDQTHGLGLIRTHKDGLYRTDPTTHKEVPLTPKEHRTIIGDQGEP